MAVVIDATVGGENSNSYCTLAEADAYHESRLFTDTWDDAEDDTKNRALVMATRLLDSHVVWGGYAANSGVQALQWPRGGMYDAFDEAISKDEIPRTLKDATAEFARLLIDADLPADVSSQGIGSVGLGPIKVDFSSEGQQRKVIPEIVKEMVSLWIAEEAFASTSAVKLVRT